MAQEILQIPTEKTALGENDVLEGQSEGGGPGSSFFVKRKNLIGSVRTITGNDSSVQTDDNSLLIFNSASPIDFTLEQLSTNTVLSFWNIGAGAVTFLNGTGVTLVGASTLPGSVGTDYPGGAIAWLSPTSPRIASGINKIDLSVVDVSGGTITLDCNNQVERMFVGSATFGSAKAVTITNDTNALVINFKFNFTNVAAVLTLDADVTMQTNDGRWNNGAKTFTPAATGKHEFSATWDGTSWDLKATNPYA